MAQSNDQDDSDQMRNDEIFALSEIFSDTCKKEDNDVITFDIQEPEFKDKKIQFQVRFIKSYPKSSKPDFMLIADWLTDDLIKTINDKFDEIWNENLNQPIIYLWIEAIKEIVLKWLEDKEEESKEDEKIDYDYKKIEQNFTKLNVTNKKDISNNSKDEKFEFHHGEPLIIKRSVFQAHLLHIDDESKIPLARKQLMEYKRVSEATHNIWAYRIIKNLDNRTIEHSNYDDDGETQAGGRLHLLLQLTDSKNVLVVVSRYFGGIKLGPDRFKYINEVAKNLLNEQGVICPKEGKQKGKKKK